MTKSSHVKTNTIAKAKRLKRCSRLRSKKKEIMAAT